MAIPQGSYVYIIGSKKRLPLFTTNYRVAVTPS